MKTTSPKPRDGPADTTVPDATALTGAPRVVWNMMPSSLPLMYWPLPSTGQIERASGVREAAEAFFEFEFEEEGGAVSAGEAAAGAEGGAAGIDAAGVAEVGFALDGGAVSAGEAATGAG